MGLTGYQITGRPKHLWSIYQKMTHKEKEFSGHLRPHCTGRVLPTGKSCYSSSVPPTPWRPLTYCFKDYIATPKANGYQSLHTTVIGLGPTHRDTDPYLQDRTTRPSTA